MQILGAFIRQKYIRNNFPINYPIFWSVFLPKRDLKEEYIKNTTLQIVILNFLLLKRFYSYYQRVANTIYIFINLGILLFIFLVQFTEVIV